MDLSLLATLKDRLTQADQFDEVLDFFLTHFGERRQFSALRERVEHPFLEAVIAQIGG